MFGLRIGRGSPIAWPLVSIEFSLWIETCIMGDASQIDAELYGAERTPSLHVQQVLLALPPEPLVLPTPPEMQEPPELQEPPVLAVLRPPVALATPVVGFRVTG